LLVGQKAGDGLDRVGQMMAVAVVPGDGSPVFEVGDAVLDGDAP
jgi:hypothetical protein